MRYLIIHRHGDQYLRIEAGIPFWAGDMLNATFFESILEAKKALKEYSKGSYAGYPWIGLEKGAFIGHLNVEMEAFISECSIEKWKEDERSNLQKS
jgi:hypothetical protein